MFVACSKGGSLVSSVFRKPFVAAHLYIRVRGLYQIPVIAEPRRAFSWAAKAFKSFQGLVIGARSYLRLVNDKDIKVPCGMAVKLT